MILRLPLIFLSCRIAASFTLFESATRSFKCNNVALRDTGTATAQAEATPAVASAPRTPFKIFNDHNVERIYESDGQGISQLSENVEAQKVLQPIVSWSEIQRLSSSTKSTMEERMEFVHRFSSTGGYLLLELEESQAYVVEDMWASLQAFFDREDLKDDELHHQTIAREGDAHENLGYKFVQTYNTPGDLVLPTTIQEALGNSPTSQRGAADSFLLLAEIASKIASVVAAGALDEDPEVMQSVVDGLLHTSSTHFASSNHRLSRYVLTESEANPLKESLRSHTDWTLTTPIPLSATSGLHLWKPHSKQWVAPEALVTGLPLPRTRYVVVLAGKWIELLTKQRVLACVHRVVTQTSQEPRLSAPFFLRPKEFVFESLSGQFNDPEQASDDMSTEEAIARIHSMFQGFIDLTKDADR